MEEYLKSLMKTLEDKYGGKDPADVEYWDTGNFDDTYGMGWDAGEYALAEQLLKKIKDGSL